MRFVKTAESLFSIPQGFTRVEYLQSTGTQWIDTGYKPNSNTKVEAKFKMNSTPNKFTWLFLARNANVAGGGFGFGCIANGSISSEYNNRQTSSTKLTGGTTYTITKDKNVCKFNNETLTNTASTFTVDYTLPIFTLNNVGELKTDTIPDANCYYFRIYDNDVLVRNFIPCIDSLGVACMYDLVGKKPYYNQGTGTFTAGRRIIPVEYLESTGTQYIDTGVGGDLTTELTCEAAITQAGNASVTNIMGNNVTSSRAITINMSANITNPSPSRIRFGNTDNTTDAGAIDLNTFYKYDTNKNELTVRDSSGTVLNTYPLNATTAFTTNGNILIYKLGDTSTQYIGKIKVSNASIKNSGVLVRDFIPCKDENNIGFMFDTLSGTVYLNAGTGAFSVGENKYISKLRLIKDAIQLPDEYTRVEYLESSGTQYIDTGISGSSSLKIDVCAEQTNTSEGAVFGCGASSAANDRIQGYWASQRASIRMDGTVYDSSSAPSSNQKIIFILDLQNKKGYINGVEYISNYSGSVSAKNIWLFGRNTNDQDTVKFNNSKIYYSKIYNNGTLVRSFIPVRDSNNVGYMFDEVTGQIFGNLGSGSFGIGNDLPTAKVRFIQDVLPREYRPLKYLQSTGTQYIDLGIGVKSNTVFKATFSVASTATGRSYFGARNSSNERFQIVNSIGIGGGYFYNANIYPIANKKYEIEMYANGDVYLDGVKRNATNGTFSPVAFERNLWLFATNYYDGSGVPSASTFWSVIIYEGDVPVRDLYPALRKSDNKPGMYDRITKQFFVNQGTGEFNYG